MIGLIFSPLWGVIRWIFLPWNCKFCRHDWKYSKLPATYGVFAGLEQRVCSKCGMGDTLGAKERLQRNGLL